MTEKKTIEKEIKTGTLFLVSTPIGNHEDITLHAQRVLKNCDKVICEEEKVAARLLKKYNLNKDFELLNEQNETEYAPEIIEMLQAGMNLALISDCGTPVFADPGHELVKLALAENIDIEVVPGVSSIMTALVRSGLDITSFVFGGFLPRLREERYEALRLLRDETRTVVLLETPYRLVPVLEAAAKLMPERNVYLGCNLTMPFETHHYGTFEEIYNKFVDLEFKGEFVICFSGNTFKKPVRRAVERGGGYSSPRGERKGGYDRNTGFIHRKDYSKDDDAIDGNDRVSDDFVGRRESKEFVYVPRPGGQRDSRDSDSDNPRSSEGGFRGGRDRRDSNSEGGFRGNRDIGRSSERRSSEGGYRGSRDSSAGSGYKGSRDSGGSGERRSSEGGYRGSRDSSAGGGYKGSRDSGGSGERRSSEGGYRGSRDSSTGGGYKGSRDSGGSGERRSSEGGYRGSRDSSSGGGYKGNRDSSGSGERRPSEGGYKGSRDSAGGGYKGKKSTSSYGKKTGGFGPPRKKAGAGFDKSKGGSRGGFSKGK
jgi:16S rRNA (cytidine1402-2'-O)-methyltransferase